ncbi:MAG: hypothetical protein RLY71_418 [Pseudomonadota bacterium]|jgi:hypothetical protein
MSTWAFYDLATGDYAGRSFSGPAGLLGLNTPTGCIAMPWQHDPTRWRVEWRTDDYGDSYHSLVPWRPQKPADTELSTWRWDAMAERWVAEPTLAAHAAAVREERARRLAACDWVVARAADSGEPVPEVWRTYRAALRDVTEQAGFPMDMVWPDPPSSR